MASGKPSLHASCNGPLGIPLQSVPGPKSSSGVRPEPEVSSPVLTWILRFLWSLHRGVRPRLEWRHASLFLPRCSSSVRLPSELTRGSVSFPRGATGLSHVSLWCESILTVTVVAMQGNQVHLKLTETFGCLLEWWHDPWSSFIWR